MSTQVVVSMDIGGTNLRLALVAVDGNVLARSQVPCRISEGRSAFLDNIALEYSKIRNHASESGLAIVAAGTGVPGLIDSSGTVLSSVNLKPLDGFNLKVWLEQSLGVPVTTLNDANAAAVAEHQYGAGRGFRSLLHLTLGTGVGSGLILDGMLWTGSDGVAAEYGHMTVEPNGRLCQCGNHGCLEQYSSASAIRLSALEKIAAGVKTMLVDVPSQSLDSSVIAEAALYGDQTAIDCFEEAGRYLGIAAAGAVNLLNLDAIIFGGGVAASFELLAPVIQREIRTRAFEHQASRVKVLKGELGDNAGIMGAAAAAFSLISSS